MTNKITTHKLKFDKEKHEYSVGNKKVLSVTTVLPDIPEHLIYKQFFIDATHRGTRVHEHVDTINKYYIKKNKILSSDLCSNCLETDKPYVNSYIKFLKAHRPEMLLSEKKMFHTELFYAGTVDLVAVIKGKLSILDVKTTTKIAPYAKLQLAAYVYMYNFCYPERKAFNRYIIHLQEKNYRLVPYTVKTLEDDFEIFQCKLKSAQWDAENLSRYK